MGDIWTQGDAGISIHALLAESDRARHGRAAQTAISIHALLAESDGKPLLRQAAPFSFLSTLSLRRATHDDGCEVPDQAISIHALLAESDSKSAQNSGALLRI